MDEVLKKHQEKTLRLKNGLDGLLAEQVAIYEAGREICRKKARHDVSLKARIEADEEAFIQRRLAYRQARHRVFGDNLPDRRGAAPAEPEELAEEAKRVLQRLSGRQAPAARAPLPVEDESLERRAGAPDTGEEDEPEAPAPQLVPAGG